MFAVVRREQWRVVCESAVNLCAQLIGWVYPPTEQKGGGCSFTLVFLKQGTEESLCFVLIYPQTRLSLMKVHSQENFFGEYKGV